MSKTLKTILQIVSYVITAVLAAFGGVQASAQGLF